MSLLDKIRQEAIAPTVKVPPRTDPLIEPAPPELKVVEAAPKATSLESEIAGWEAELAELPAIADKKVGVRLEEEVLRELEALCNLNKVSIETLLESFYVVCKGKESTMKQVIREAQRRMAERKRAGNIRSLITKTRNLLKR